MMQAMNRAVMVTGRSVVARTMHATGVRAMTVVASHPSNSAKLTPSPVATNISHRFVWFVVVVVLCFHKHAVTLHRPTLVAPVQQPPPSLPLLTRLYTHDLPPVLHAWLMLASQVAEIRALAARTGEKIQDESLLLQALTHRTFDGYAHNGRLALLGTTQ